MLTLTIRLAALVASLFKGNGNSEYFCTAVVCHFDEFVFFGALRPCDVSHHLVGKHTSLGFIGKYGTTVVVEIDAVDDMKMIAHGGSQLAACPPVPPPPQLATSFTLYGLLAPRLNTRIFAGGLYFGQQSRCLLLALSVNSDPCLERSLLGA
jgi:hypothetical protein